MRLIVVNDHGFVNGGGAQVAIASLNALAEAGLDVTFVSSVGPVDALINRDHVSIINFGLSDLQNNPSKVQAAVLGIWNISAASYFENVLKDFDPRDTVIHFHTWMSSLSSSVIKVAIINNFKVVCTLHDYSSVCPNGGLYNYEKSNHCKLVPMSVSCLSVNCDSRSYYHKLWRVTRQAVQNICSNLQTGVDTFITVSSYSENLIRPFLPYTCKFKKINNPIDIEKYPPPDVTVNDGFTFVGRISKEKGGVLFAEAARLANVKSTFVGTGGEEPTIRLLNTASIFLGWQDRQGVVKAIRSSRALVFPSLLHETQGLVVQEAAALGVPVIASNECAASEFIVDGVTGLLFKARDHQDLANKIKLLNNDATLARNIARNSYEQYWSAPHTLQNHVNDLIDCYRVVLYGSTSDNNVSG